MPFGKTIKQWPAPSIQTQHAKTYPEKANAGQTGHGRKHELEDIPHLISNTLTFNTLQNKPKRKPKRPKPHSD